VQPKGSQRPADPGPGLSDDHAAWSPPAASRRVILASSLSRSAWPTANHLPRRPSPSRPSAGLVRPSASFEGQASTSGRRRAVMDTAGDHAGHPSRAAAGPTATPRDLIPSDTADAGTHGHREPDTGHLTLRRPHRTPVTGQAPVGQRTLAPDTDGDFGSSVEPTAKLHPLCTVALREVASVVAASSLGRSGDWRRSLDDLFVADVRTGGSWRRHRDGDMVGGRWVEHLAAHNTCSRGQPARCRGGGSLRGFGGFRYRWACSAEAGDR
jgi:hypothetical protein